MGSTLQKPSTIGLTDILLDQKRQVWLVDGNKPMFGVLFFFVASAVVLALSIVYIESTTYRDAAVSLALVPCFMVPVSFGFVGLLPGLGFTGFTTRKVVVWSWILAHMSLGVGRVLIAMHCNSMYATQTTWPFPESVVDRTTTASYWCDGPSMCRNLFFELMLLSPALFGPSTFLEVQATSFGAGIYYFTMGIIGRNGQMDSTLFLGWMIVYVTASTTKFFISLKEQLLISVALANPREAMEFSVNHEKSATDGLVGLPRQWTNSHGGSGGNQVMGGGELQAADFLSRTSYDLLSCLGTLSITTDFMRRCHPSNVARHSWMLEVQRAMTQLMMTTIMSSNDYVSIIRKQTLRPTNEPMSLENLLEDCAELTQYHFFRQKNLKMKYSIDRRITKKRIYSDPVWLNHMLMICLSYARDQMGGVIHVRVMRVDQEEKGSQDSWNHGLVRFEIHDEFIESTQQTTQQTTTERATKIEETSALVQDLEGGKRGDQRKQLQLVSLNANGSGNGSGHGSGNDGRRFGGNGGDGGNGGNGGGNTGNVGNTNNNTNGISGNGWSSTPVTSGKTRATKDGNNLGDNGSDIDLHGNKEKLFHPVDNRGSKMGLSILKFKCALMHGQCGVGKPGQPNSSTIWFEVPYRLSTDTTSPSSTTTGSNSTNDANDSNNSHSNTHLDRNQTQYNEKVDSTVSSSISVLVIEDDHTTQMVICALIQSLGVSHIDVAFSGEEGIRLMKLRPYSMIFFNPLILPRMNGAECVRKFRHWEKIHRSSHQFICGLSAVVGGKSNCMDAGMDDCVLKVNSAVRVAKLIKDRLLSSRSEASDTPMSVAQDRVQERNLLSMSSEPRPLVDIEEFREQLFGQEENMFDFVKLFLEQGESTMLKFRKSLINESYHAKGWTACQHQAHALKGAAMMMHADPLAEACRKLEAFTSNLAAHGVKMSTTRKQDLQAIHQMGEAIETIWVSTVAVLEALLN